MSYSDKDIKVLKGLEAVRLRPGMYIGSTDSKGLHHLIWELLDNAIDEVLAGYATLIKVVLHKNGSVSVIDNGRGIPTGKNNYTKLSTVDTVFTTLHAGGKFNQQAYKVSGGLHGVGASVVNALSSWLIVKVARNNKMYQSQYANGGKIQQQLTMVGKSVASGTCVTFMPDNEIFSSIEFNPALICEKLQESSFLFKKIKFVFINEIDDDKKTFISDNGIVDFVCDINKNFNHLSPVIYYHAIENEIDLEIAMQYNDQYSDIINSFANSIKTKDGGSHEQGFKMGLLDAINEFARKNAFLKEKEQNFELSDIKEGLVAIISLKIPENKIQYDGQTKSRLSTTEAYAVAKHITINKMNYWLSENKKIALKILEKICQARKARIAARISREQIRQIKDVQSEKNISGKLTPCQSKNSLEREIFLVEGDSAGGTAKLARNRYNQAILPLKGKIINVEKASVKDILANEEIITITACLGAGLGNKFDINKLKYHKVIIMTDADTDGSHIQILLLTFFYRYMKPMIENGNVYLANAPLYKINSNSDQRFFYVWNNNELEELKLTLKNYTIQRYKGLGEMSAEQLWQSTMDPKARKLTRVTINDLEMCESKVQIIMGENTNVRKQWINENVDFEIEE